MKKLHLIPDLIGKVLLYEGFWKQGPKHNELALLKIVYADLVGTGDSRNIEKLHNDSINIIMGKIFPIAIIELLSDAQMGFVEKGIL